MKNPEREQLLFENWQSDSADETPKTPLENEPLLSSHPTIEHDKEECKVCGDSGPCSACDRGIALAKEQGRAYRRSKR